MRMTLSRKGLLLILLPLVVQIACFLMYDRLLARAVDLYHKQMHAKEVIGHLNWLAVLAALSTLCGDGYALSGDANLLAAYKECIANFEEDRKKNVLLFSVSGYEKDYSHLMSLSDRLTQHLSSIVAIRQKTTGTQPDASEIAKAAASPEIQAMWQDMGSTRRNILAHENVRTPLQHSDVPSAFSELRAITNGGIILSLTIIIGIMIFYSRDIADRLSIMMDNVRRLPLGETLNARVSGSDEISTLDASFHDMTAALLEAREKERAILDNAIDVICALDAHGRFTQLSRSVLNGWGRRAGELLETAAYDILVPESQETFRQALAKASDSGEKIHCDVQIKTDAREPIDALWTGAWSRENNSFYCVVHDVTQARKMERMKREFVAMISHDLRSPLMSVQVFLQLLSSDHFGEMPEQVAKRARMSASDTSRLINLINNLLDIEKMEDGQMKVFRQPVEVKYLLERCRDAVESLAERSQISLEMSTSEEVVNVDEGLMIQVLVNLLSNAIKFSPAHSVVRVDFTEKEGEGARFAVVDRGRGIPRDKLEIIFDRFKQVEADDARKKGGSGLGLAICKTIVEAHGGKIGVESEDGKGSTFWFTVN